MKRFVMAQWQQFQASAPSQGFASLPTGPELNFKWKMQIGSVAFSSPVIAEDGTVYVGNLQGELSAIAPNGTLLWKKMLDQRGSFIPGSPAIDQNGNIYVVTTYKARVRDHRSGTTIRSYVARSKLHCLNSVGQLRWSFIFPLNNIAQYTGGFSLSSPKIWGGRNPLIFIPAVYTTSAPVIEILTIDQNGNLLQRSSIAGYSAPPITSDGGILDDIWDFLNGSDFNPSGGEIDLGKRYGWPEPSISIADFGPHASRPIIIIDDNYKQLAAYRWQNEQLINLWKKVSAKPRPSASPATLLSSVVVAGKSDGILSIYDLLTGNELFNPWFKTVPIYSPVASFLSQIYLVAGPYVFALYSDGKLLNKFQMKGHTISAPAISADRVYVNAQDGLYSFSLDLKQHILNSDVQGGVSSPAIANDGTIYVIDRNKQLWAFGT